MEKKMTWGARQASHAFPDYDGVTNEGAAVLEAEGLGLARRWRWRWCRQQPGQRSQCVQIHHARGGCRGDCSGTPSAATRSGAVCAGRTDCCYHCTDRRRRRWRGQAHVHEGAGPGKHLRWGHSRNGCLPRTSRPLWRPCHPRGQARWRWSHHGWWWGHSRQRGHPSLRRLPAHARATHVGWWSPHHGGGPGASWGHHSLGSSPLWRWPIHAQRGIASS